MTHRKYSAFNVTLSVVVNLSYYCFHLKMMKNFQTELFISEIQKRRSIWDTTSTEHAIRELKKKDWDEVIDIFGGDNMSQADRHVLGFTLKKRWKNIRTCFARELKRQKNYGSGAGRKSEYMYYKYLLFLTNVINIVDKDMDEYQDYEDIEQQEDTIIENKNKHKVTDEDSYSDEEDEDRMFLLSLYKTMKRIPKNKKMAVKIKMLSILNEVIHEDEKNVLFK